MKKQLIVSLVALSWAPALFAGTDSSDYPIRAASMLDVHVTSGFWFDRFETNRLTTLKTCFAKCNETPRIANFTNCAARAKGKFGGIFFDDSDVYKVMEGAAYIYAETKDPQLKKYMDWLISEVAKAQEPDGYLYTARTLGGCKAIEGTARWEGLAWSHELYNPGHMIEAAVAWYQATGETNFLAVARKNANLIDRTFGWEPDKLKMTTGHQEMELALCKLYRATRDERYLKLSKFLLDMRGRKDLRPVWGCPSQDHLPVLEQEEAVGHAVRAGYMYSGMADVAALTGDTSYVKAIERLWENVVGRKLHLNGGIGAGHDVTHPKWGQAWEAFGADYFLPNEDAYLETCAAIANALWNQRLFCWKGETKYVDVLERTIYNGFVSGISLTGDEFFYPNPLANKTGLGNAKKKPYKRSKWFGCSCCPVNDVRFIPQVPSFAYATDATGSLYWNLFMQGEAEVGGWKFKVETDYPWSGKAKLTILARQTQSQTLKHSNDQTSKRRIPSLKIRIPGWAVGKPVPSDLYTQTAPSSFMEVAVSVNGLALNCCPDAHGYVSIGSALKKGDVVEVDLPMSVKRIRAHEKVEADRGRLAVERGPIVYCAEGVDNGGKAFDAVLPADVTFADDTIKIGDKTFPALKASNGLKLIPYCLWGNREPGNEMQCWFRVVATSANSSISPSPKLGAADFNVAIETDRIDGLYLAGETATVSVSAKDKKGAFVRSGRVDVAVDNFGTVTVTNLTADFAVANPYKFRVTRRDPGFLRAQAAASNVVCGIGFDVGHIAPGTPNPADFAQFWREAIAKYDHEVPSVPEARVDEALSDADWIVERVSFAAPCGRTAYGFVTRERKAKGRLPGRVVIPGAGYGSWSQSPVKTPGRITLMMTVFPFEPDVKLGKRAEYDALDRAAKDRWGTHRYCQGGISESREAYFYYPVILANNRAIDWFAARSDVDASKIDYSGTSQGGGLGLAAMALNGHFARGCVYVPALTDLLGYKAGNRKSGWPELVENHSAGAKSAIERNAPYFCGVNFARMIRTPIRFCVGHVDPACPPADVYAAYNVCPSADKAILGGVGMGHGVFPDYYSHCDAWSRGQEVGKPQVRLLAFNIWGDYFGNPVPERAGDIAALVRRWNPDIAGFQEMTARFWKSALVTELEKDYVIVGRGLGFEKRDVHTPVLYRRSRFDLIESGIVLQCPELDDSKGAVWVVLKDKTTGRKLVAFASHAWWRYDGAGDDWIRLNGAKRLAEKMHELAKRHDAAVVGGGDLNAPLESGSLKWLLSHGYADAQASAEVSPRGFPTEHGDPKRGPDGRYVGRNAANGHNRVPEKSRYLDHIFFDPGLLAARRFDIDISPVACRISDHHPIILDFDFK